MINIVKKKNKISRDLLSKIEWACRLNSIKFEHQFQKLKCPKCNNIMKCKGSGGKKKKYETLNLNSITFTPQQLMADRDIEREKENFVFELFYNIYCIILQK